MDRLTRYDIAPKGSKTVPLPVQRFMSGPLVHVEPPPVNQILSKADIHPKKRLQGLIRPQELRKTVLATASPSFDTSIQVIGCLIRCQMVEPAAGDGSCNMACPGRLRGRSAPPQLVISIPQRNTPTKKTVRPAMYLGKSRFRTLVGRKDAKVVANEHTCTSKRKCNTVACTSEPRYSNS